MARDTGWGVAGTALALAALWRQGKCCVPADHSGAAPGVSPFAPILAGATPIGDMILRVNFSLTPATSSSNLFNADWDMSHFTTGISSVAHAGVAVAKRAYRSLGLVVVTDGTPVQNTNVEQIGVYLHIPGASAQDIWLGAPRVDLPTADMATGQRVFIAGPVPISSFSLVTPRGVPINALTPYADLVGAFNSFMTDTMSQTIDGYVEIWGGF